MFSAQYQQRPVPLEGNLIHRDWFHHYDELPEILPKRVVQSWDVAMATGSTNDYSVCTTWEIIKNDYYLVDVFRGRLKYPDLRRKVMTFAGRFNPEAVLIEDAGPGMALLQDLRRDLPQGMTRPIGRKPQGSKVDRMVAQSAKIEAGQVYLPREAEWLDTFLLELLAFPFGRQDDQVDSISQFLDWVSLRNYLDSTMMVATEVAVFQDGIRIN